MSRAQPIGEQLVKALRDARPEHDFYFPAYAVGYLEGILTDIAAQSPEARKLIQGHIDAQRAKIASAAA